MTMIGSENENDPFTKLYNCAISIKFVNCLVLAEKSTQRVSISRFISDPDRGRTKLKSHHCFILGTKDG